MPTAEEIVMMIKDKLLELYRQKSDGHGYASVNYQIHAYETLLSEIVEVADGKR